MDFIKSSFCRPLQPHDQQKLHFCSKRESVYRHTCNSMVRKIFSGKNKFKLLLPEKEKGNHTFSFGNLLILYQQTNIASIASSSSSSE